MPRPKRKSKGLLIGARAAYFTPPPPPREMRRRGMQLAYEAELKIRTGADDGETAARRAIEALVDAFLVDRKGNSICFTRAHRIGRELLQRFGCSWKFDPEEERFENECGVLALHSRIAASYGGTALTVCTICDAGDLQCDHIPGETYAGERCVRRVVRWEAEEVSLTDNPADPRCFRVSALLDEDAARARPDVEMIGPGQAMCTHCQSCPGVSGPSAEDLDPSLWEAVES